MAEPPTHSASGPQMMPARGATTAARVLAAARRRLLSEGYAALSMRKVAAEAGVPLSQVHYHFGSKAGLLLALLEEENERRLARQAEMYAGDMPLWERYEQACDFLEDDLDSGYVRLLQELIAAGWSDADLGRTGRDMLAGWYRLLVEVSSEAEERFGGLGGFTPEEVAAIVGAMFIGGESMLLLGIDQADMPIRAALRRVGQLIRYYEEQAPKGTSL